MSDPIVPNPEIAAIALRWFHSYGRGEAETILNLLSDDPALNYVGTAENEYGSGDNFRRAFPEYVAAHSLFEFTDPDITAFSCGNVGWAIGLGTVNVVTGESERIRVTQIYHMLHGFWRLIHVHNSMPTANIDGVGQDLAQFQDLLDAALSSPTELARTGLATIMFTDIADSTTIAATVGDARWSGAIKSHIARVDQIITDHSGTLIKSLGDGTMSVFNSARAALAAATDRRGAAIVTRAIALAYPLTLIVLPLAPNAALLGLALFLFGAAHGAMDVAMNSWGAEVERHFKTPMMSSFHAMFSLGAGLGALSGYIAIQAGAGVSLHFLVSASVISTLTLWLAHLPWVSATRAPRAGSVFAFPSGPLVLVGTLPTDRASLEYHYTLADDDIAYINTRRRSQNQIGLPRVWRAGCAVVSTTCSVRLRPSSTTGAMC